MNETLSHKGYTGSVEVSIEDCCLHGKILFIEDIITYEGNAVEEIKSSFIEAVDRYLSYCDEMDCSEFPNSAHLHGRVRNSSPPK
jgi:predicted HicB family RNase H-like nuclease